MSVPEPFRLPELISQSLVDVLLYDEITDDHLDEYEYLWKPRLRRAHGLGHLPVEDAHWDWTQKVLPTRNRLDFKHFCLVYDSLAQGLMQLELVRHKSRLEPNKDLVYIDYVTVAPWNRGLTQARYRLKGVGGLLVARAIRTSLDEGFHGRVGLHSLPGASGFYRKTGATSFGCDASYHNLEYFELSRDAAKVYINNLSAQST